LFNIFANRLDFFRRGLRFHDYQHICPSNPKFTGWGDEEQFLPVARQPAWAGSLAQGSGQGLTPTKQIWGGA
jgi:hypothetical protein